MNNLKFDSKAFGKIAAYVMQDDVLFDTMTVKCKS